MFFKIRRILILLLIFSSKINSEIVKTTYGYVNSTIGISRNGREFLKFLGIPYAAPPIENLRLANPIDPPSWQGIRNSQAAPDCMQPSRFYETNGIIIGEEDCLYLNVFTLKHFLSHSEQRKNILMPVMIYIHGGGFKTGGSTSYNAEYFMDRNVILVTINYRLGPLGFLSLGNNIISGNYGLKDQIHALKWIQKNIKAFGGNPDKVTLFGHSAGAISTNLHMFSPLSKGLYHQAIMQSGSAFCPSAYSLKNYTKTLGTSFLFLTGCYFDDPHASLDCLRKLKPDLFVDVEKKLHIWEGEPIVLFKPTIESKRQNWLERIKNKFKPTSKTESEIPLLPNKPKENNYIFNVPFMIGITSADGDVFAEKYLTQNGKLAKLLNSDYRRLLQFIIEYIYASDKPEKFVEAAEIMKNSYFGEKDIGPDTDIELMNLMTDALMTYPLIRTLQSTNASKYAYYYEHMSSFGKQKHIAKYGKYYGPGHGDELHLLFYSPEMEKNMSSSDISLSKQLINYWVNFATYGDPNGNEEEKFWKPMISEDMEFLHIKNESNEMSKDFFNKYDFWKTVPLGV